MSPTFVENLTQGMPAGITLPQELITTFDWMEAQGWLQSNAGDAPTDYYMPVYPPDQFLEPYASAVVFTGTDLPYTGHWSTPDPAIDARIFEIADVSGDGGRAAIWLDPDGKQQFVMIGHDTLGVLTDDPVKFLQLMAMGYLELSSVDDFSVTPLNHAVAYNGLENLAAFEALSPDEPPMLVPTALQAFLQSEFGVTAPASAMELGIKTPAPYGEEDSEDAFVAWNTAVTPPPTPEELAYIEELAKIAENMTIEDLNLDDPDEPKGIIDTLKGFLSPNK